DSPTGQVTRGTLAPNTIESLIDDVQSQTDVTVEEIDEVKDRITTGVDTVNDALEAFEDVVENVEETNTGVQEISDATDDQADSTQEVVSMVDDVASISEETAAEAKNVRSASQRQTETISEVAESTNNLSNRTESLRNLVNEFEFRGGDFTEATPEEADRILDSGGYELIDVRTQAEHDDYRIPGTDYVIPHDEVRDRLGEIESNRVVVYCKKGGRSAKAAQILARNGFEDVVNIQGGVDGWRDTGLPVEE
ncbi:MAG: rhodanese-like domain-containing protein, partial [Halobacteria archaeon]|nr:rhodanese-like domain-containing protein [Halobacteria archaeon]